MGSQLSNTLQFVMCAEPTRVILVMEILQERQKPIFIEPLWTVGPECILCVAKVYTFI